ncbi:MAG: DNA/RNA non-specific endonuclease [Clostridia bacterium]|nr:DNA/RNA non-specific endonuclease [Clostridia bacterium]
MFRKSKSLLALLLALVLVMTMSLTACDGMFATGDGVGDGSSEGGNGDNSEGGNQGNEGGNSGGDSGNSGNEGSGDGNEGGEVDYEGIPDVEENEATLISKILNGTDGQSYTVRGTVVAYNAQSFLIKDSTGSVLVYKGSSWASDLEIGDVVEVSGKRTVYGNAPQFGTDATYEKLDSVQYKQPTPTPHTPAELNAYSSASKITPVYVKLTGSLEISKSSDGTKTYYNFNIDSTSIIGSLTYPKASELVDFNAMDGNRMEVEGWITGVTAYGKYLNLITVSYKDLGAEGNNPGSTGTSGVVIKGIEIPAYAGDGYYRLNNNTPFFTDSDKKFVGYEYSALDDLGRATGAIARLTKSLMPTDDREDIGHIRPTGWKQAAYPSLGLKNLYDRSHLLAHSLMSDDVHVENLVTGTVYMNQNVMTTFEGMVRDAVKAGTDVLYRVTPIYLGNNLVASGLLMEAYSILDGGDDICFCVYLYNVQPGVEIDYATGNNWLAGSGDSGSGDSGSGDSGSGSQVEGLPESGKAYYLTATSGSDTFYATGKISSKTMGTTKDAAEAAKIYFEATDTEGVYYIYYMNGSTKTYITMSTDATKAFGTSTTATDNAKWKLDVSGKYIFNNVYSERAMAFYAQASDIRTYKTSTSAPFLWFCEA